MALALVVVEEHAGAAVHLGHDHPLGAVHHEGAVRGHERHVAHVDVLLLDVLDGLRAGVRVHVEHDEAQRHLEGRRIGHAALAALVHVELGRLELVAHEFEQRRAGEVGDGEHRAEHRLQPLVRAAAFGHVDQQELVVGRLLNLDQVRHLGNFPDVTEEFADPFPAGVGLRHDHPRPLWSDPGAIARAGWFISCAGAQPWRTGTGAVHPGTVTEPTPRALPRRSRRSAPIPPACRVPARNPDGRRIKGPGEDLRDRGNPWTRMRRG